MKIPPYTPTPNSLFDFQMRELTESELKILLTVIRKTLGWIDTATGKRKQWDWISTKQFVQSTGLSNKSIARAIHSLIHNNLIVAVDEKGIPLKMSSQRRDAQRIYYALGRALLEQISVIH